MRQGRFREDLYYRINVLPVQIPPLAERRDEIPGWASFMVQRRHDENGRGGRAEITPEVVMASAPYWLADVYKERKPKELQKLMDEIQSRQEAIYKKAQPVAHRFELKAMK